MRRRTISILVGVIVLAGFSTYYVGNVRADTFNPYQYALGQLSRAESAQTSEEVTDYTKAARTELTRVGYVSWWSTDKETFGSILTRLDSIITRAEGISSLEPENDTYISEMFDMHAQLMGIQASLLF